MIIQEQKVAENWSDAKELLKESKIGRITTWIVFLMGFTFGIVVYVVFQLMSLPKRLSNRIRNKKIKHRSFRLSRGKHNSAYQGLGGSKNVN